LADKRRLHRHPDPRIEADALSRAPGDGSAYAAAGGRDNGTPGLRPNCGPNYYAAFVYDPDGHNVETVRYSME